MYCDGVPLLAYNAARFEVAWPLQKTAVPINHSDPTTWEKRVRPKKTYRSSIQHEFSVNSWVYSQNPSGLFSNETESLFFLVSDSSYYMGPVPTWTHWYLPVSEQLCSRSWGGVRHRFVYVLKPTSRARRESHMSTQIPKHRIRFHRDISHYCLLWALSLLCVLVIS